MSSQYSFPILETREILECMMELGCTVSEEQLTKPSADHISRLMEQLLDLFLGFSTDESSQMRFSGMDAFDFPELHEFSVGQLAFNRSIMKLMLCSGVHDFSLKDIQKPEHKRLIKIFSAIINFAKFREEKVGAYEDFVARSQAIEEEKESVDAKCEELTEQLHYLRAQRKQEQPLINELVEENQKMEDHIKALNVEQGAIKSKIHELKQLRQATSDKRDHDQFALLNVKAEVTKLQGLVVRSPERTKREIKEMGFQLETDKENLTELDGRHQGMRRKFDGLAKTEKDVGKLTKQLREAEEHLVKLKASKKEGKALASVIGEHNSQLEDLESQGQSLVRQGNSIASRVAEQDAKQKMMKEAATRELEKWRGLQVAADQENVHHKAQIEELDDQARLIEKRMVDLEMIERLEMDKLLAEHSKVESELHSYNQRILAAISVD